jgi:hypothetical protein
MLSYGRLPAYAVAVERVAQTLQGLESLPFYNVLRDDARGGSSDRLAALGALAEMKAISAELLNDSSLEAGAKKSALDSAHNLARRVREQVFTQAAANRRVLWNLMFAAGNVLLFLGLITPFGASAKRKVSSQSQNDPIAA